MLCDLPRRDPRIRGCDLFDHNIFMVVDLFQSEIKAEQINGLARAIGFGHQELGMSSAYS
jgi:hypothetical protein